MARYAVRNTKWKIFIDGVELPWQTFSVKVGVDFAGSASIVLEHDQLLRDLRPRSVIGIFMRDGFEDVSGLSEEAADRKALKLFWEGDLESFADHRTPTSRNFIIEGVGFFSVFARHRLFLSGTGKLPVVHLISGSTLFKQVAAHPRQLFNYAVFGDLFSTAKDQKIPVKAIGTEEEIVYAERLTKILTYFSAYSASLRLQTVRTNILGKIASLADKTLSYMIPRSMASAYFKQANSSLPNEATALDLINIFNNYAYHHYVSIMGPHLSTGETERDDRLIKPSGFSDDKATVFAIPTPFKRNDYVILPETFYAIPPSCNIIFPEFIEAFNISRTFSAEPTRAVLTDTHMNSNLVVVAPAKIFRYGEKDMSPDEYWSINRSGTYLSEAAGEVESAYISPGGERGKRISLLAAMSDVEIEKGIIPITTYPSFEYFSAISSAFDMANPDTVDQVKSLLKEMPDLDALSGKGNEGKKYIHIMQTLAEYNLTLAKFTRQANISMNGHRWMVPGMTAPILTTGGSYIGWIRQIGFAVELDGQESTQVELDYVRPIPKADFGIAREAEKIIGKQLSLVGVGNTLRKSYQQIIDGMDTEYSRFLSAVTQMKGLAVEYAKLLAAVSMPMEVRDARGLAPISSNFSVERWGRNRGIAIGEMGKISSRAQFLRKYMDAEMLARINTYIDVMETTRWPNGRTAATDPVTSDAILVSIGEATKSAVATITKWANEQITIVDEAVKQRKVPKVSDANRAGIRQKIAKYRSVLNQLRGELATLPEHPSQKALEASASIRDNFPFPPIFANPDLITVREAEKIYEELFGAQKIFTEYIEESKSVEIPPITKDSAGGLYVAIENRRAYSRFLEFIQALGKIFPLGGNLTGSTVWEQKSEAAESQEAVRDWEEREILRRPTMQSLDQFLSSNKLDLTVEMSDRPTPTKFYVMVPKEGVKKVVRNEDGKELTWDDTLFSKIVDDYALAPRTIIVDGVPIHNKNSDDEITRLRKSVKDPMLTTKGRQELLIAYARQHFGSRGFDAT